MGKSPEKLARQMVQQGWTQEQVSEALAHGRRFWAANLETGGSATRYLHLETGRSVVIDDATGEVLHVGGDGFVY